MPSNGRVKSLYGRQRAVVTGHHLATQAAQETILAGGSLVDAMVCASAVLTVVLPHTSSMGGCAMALFFDARTASVQALNGSGRAPISATPDRFGSAMPQRGVKAAVTPTLVRFWARAHERFGRLAWSSLFDKAIELSDGGIGAPEELVRNLRLADTRLREQPGFAAAFSREGVWAERGEWFAQPKVARVLREIARHGEAGFYRGWVADSLVDFSTSNGGLMAQADLDLAQADWTPTLEGAFREDAVHVMPPNSVGVMMLRQLDLARADDGVARQVLNAIEVISSTKESIGDPRRTLTVGARASGAGVEPGDTTGFVAMDADGNAVAMLQSVFQPFGSGCVDPGTGVLFNNRMFDFSLERGHANEVGPQMRPAHTLNPYLILREGRAHLAGVSPGGISQTTTGLQIVARALNIDESLGEIVTRDRWSLGRDGTVLLEPGVDAEAARQLRAAGLSVIEGSEHEFYFGSAKVVRRTAQGLIEAAADPRRQACAAAW